MAAGSKKKRISGSVGDSARKTKRKKEASQSTSRDFVFEDPRNKRGVAAMEARKATLGVSFMERNKNSLFMDKRQASAESNQSEEEKMWARLVKQRRVLAKRKNLFSLEEEGAGLGGSLGAATQNPREPNEGGDEPPRKLTKQEKMLEIIMKSKISKQERQSNQQHILDTTFAIDEEFESIASMLPLTKKWRLANGTILGPHDEGVDDQVEDKPKKSVRFAKDEEVGEVDDAADEGKGDDGHVVEGKPSADASYEDLEKLFVEGPRTGRATHRTPTEAEVEADQQAVLQQLTKEKEQRMSAHDHTTGKRPNYQQTGDVDGEADLEGTLGTSELLRKVVGGKPSDAEDAQMEGSPEHESSAAKPTDFTEVLEELLAQFESQTRKRPVEFTRLDQISNLAVQLVRANPVIATEVFTKKLQTLYEEWQLRNLENKKTKDDPRAIHPDDIYTLLLFKLLSQCFPVTDWRHAICTPLALMVAAMLEQSSIHSFQDVVLALFRLTFVLEMVTETKRFVPEAICVLGNLLALIGTGFHQSADAAKQVGGFDRITPSLDNAFPEMQFGVAGPMPDADSLWAPPAPDSKEGAELKSDPLSKELGDSHVPRLRFNDVLAPEPTMTALFRTQLAKGLYQLLQSYHEIYEESVSYPEIFGSFLAILRNLEQSGRAPPVLLARHKYLIDRIGAAVNRCCKQRRPLLLQAARPIPLVLYDPFIDDWKGRKEKTESELRRQEKREQRESLRSVRRDSRFLRSERDREQGAIEAIREENYNRFVHDLEEQRHMVGVMSAKWMKRRERMMHQATKDRIAKEASNKRPLLAQVSAMDKKNQRRTVRKRLKKQQKLSSKD